MSNGTFDPVNPPDSVVDDDYVVCPYCGYQHGDAWECGDRYDANRKDDGFDCDGCGRVFSMEREYSVTYTTYPISRQRFMLDGLQHREETEAEFAERVAQMEAKAKEFLGVDDEEGAA